ncbi:MAG: hypothetical protein EZS28_038695, partial [Streblomastix strix]
MTLWQQQRTPPPGVHTMGRPNVDSGMPNHPDLRPKQFSLSSISSQLSVRWLQMKRFIRLEDSQIQEIKFLAYNNSAPP